IGIADAGSGFNNCHRHFPELIDAVRRGVHAAGGLPVEFPTISLGEVFLEPTSMLYRNLMSMDVEEMIRAQPMDAVVLVGGCDKTVPAQLMGAASAGVPAVQLVAGPMMAGRHRGERLGACTDCRRFWAKYRAGHLTAVAGRVGVPIDLATVNRLSDETPVLVDLKPSGQHYMEDFFAAGGLGAVLRELRERLHLDCVTVTGETLGARLDGEDAWVDRGVIRSVREPFQPVGGLVALFGSVAPGGAMLKRSAADARLFETEGRAVTVDSLA